MNFAYRNCKWCRGSGCNQCQIEADKEYARQFPNGPEPIATFKRPEEMQAAASCISREAMEHAFGPRGNGVQEIIDNFAAARSASQQEGA